MAHDHNIIDTDKAFTIDPFTRQVISETGAKFRIMQFDHKSERLTFTIPREIEGHDMLNSDDVEIHFTNMSDGTGGSPGQKNVGIYKVKDLRLVPDETDTLTLSWLIEEESTQLAGSLTFLIKFICHGTDGVFDSDYKWHTYPCTFIFVQAGMNNSGEVVRIHSDAIRELEKRMDKIGGVLPIVTVNDEGKILCISDGKIVAAAVANTAIKTYIDDYISSALGGDY